MKTILTRLSRNHVLLAAVLIPAAQAFGVADNFENATLIPGSAHYSNEVSLSTFTTQTGEPSVINGATNAGKTAWWKWTAPADGFCTVDTLDLADSNPLIDSVLAVFTGTAVNNLTRVSQNDDFWTNAQGGNRRGAKCTFYAVKDTTYHIVVDGFAPSSVGPTKNVVSIYLRLLRLAAESRRGAGYSLESTGLNFSANVSKTSKFSFTARIRVGRDTHVFRGVVSAEGLFLASIPRRSLPGGPPQAPLGVLLDISDGGRIYMGTGEEFDLSGSLIPVRRYSAGSVCPLAGKFVTGGGVTLYARISRTGGVTVAGRVEDGTPFVAGGPLCAHPNQSSSDNGEFPFAASLHKGGGFLFQIMRFTENGAVDHMDNPFTRYVRPPNPGSLFYPAGINTSVSMPTQVRTYFPPPSSQRNQGFLNADGVGKLTINALMGELAVKVEEALFLSVSNRFSFPVQTRKPSLKLNPSTGIVTGSITDDAGVKRSLYGALYTELSGTYLKGMTSGITRSLLFSVSKN